MNGLRVLVRVVLLAPLVALLAAGLKEAATSPFEWTTDRPYCDACVESWVASISPLIVAAPAVVMGAMGTFLVWRATRQQFSVGWLMASIGLFGIAALILVEIVVSEKGSPYETFSYGYGIDRPSNPQAVNSSLPATIVTTIVLCGSAVAVAYLYIRSIVPEGSGRYDKRSGERDAIGEMIASARSGPPSV